MVAGITKTKTPLQALRLLKAFQGLEIKRLQIEEKYELIFHKYQKNIEDVRNVSSSQINID